MDAGRPDDAFLYRSGWAMVPFSPLLAALAEMLEEESPLWILQPIEITWRLCTRDNGGAI